MKTSDNGRAKARAAVERVLGEVDRTVSRFDSCPVLALRLTLRPRATMAPSAKRGGG